MTALDNVVSAFAATEKKDALGAITVYRAAVQSLAANTALAEKEQKRLADALDVLGLGTADLVQDVETWRNCLALKESLANSANAETNFNEAVAARNAFEEEYAKQRQAHHTRVHKADYAVRAQIETGQELRRVLNNTKNVRLFGTPEQAIAKPAPKVAPPTHTIVEVHPYLMARS